MSSIFDWSKVAANNANSDSGINWTEGQLPGTVNGSARAMMGRTAEILGDIGGALTAGGTANALTVTANSAFTAYANGLVISLRIATDNTTAATLNVNGLGAKSIRKMLVNGESALIGNELQANGIYLLQYSTALNAAAGAWLLLNPTIDVPTFDAGTYTPTLTAVANVASSLSRIATWQRTRNVSSAGVVTDRVRVVGRVELTPTLAASTATQLGISLPVASAMTDITADMAGLANTSFGVFGAIAADVVNDRAQMQFPSPNTVLNIFYYTFEYTVI